MSDKKVFPFNPVEPDALPEHFLETVGYAEWFIIAVSTFSALALFIMAGHRSARGDYTGSILAALGAALSAMAPIIAKSLLFK